MKRPYTCLLGWLTVTSFAAELTPEELIRAVDKMTPEQTVELMQRFDAKFWQPIPLGFFRRMAVDVGLSWSRPDSLTGSILDSASASPDLDQWGGLDFSILWRVDSRRTRLGLRFSSWAARDADMQAAGYTRAEALASQIALGLNYQWFTSPTSPWIVWTEVSPGWATYELDVVNTPTGAATTWRTFEASYGFLDLFAGFSFRFNRALCLLVSGGYRFSDSADLDEGGRDVGSTIDTSGPVVRVGLGVNF